MGYEIEKSKGVVVGRGKDEQPEHILSSSIYRERRTSPQTNEIKFACRCHVYQLRAPHQQINSARLGTTETNHRVFIRSTTFGSGCSKTPPTFIRHHHHLPSTSPLHHQWHPNPLPWLAKPLLRPLLKHPPSPTRV